MNTFGNTNIIQNPMWDKLWCAGLIGDMVVFNSAN